MKKLIIALTLTGCAAAVAAIPPAIASVGCIVDDAIAGKPIAQIVVDCGGDVAQVIAVLGDPANAPKVAGTKAQIEADRVRASLVSK